MWLALWESIVQGLEWLLNSFYAPYRFLLQLEHTIEEVASFDSSDTNTTANLSNASHCVHCAVFEPYHFMPFEFEHVMPNRRHNRPPHPRSGHRIVATDQYIYSFGGYNGNVPDDDPDLREDPTWQSSRPLFQELWRFSKDTRVWKLLSTSGSAPRKLASHCAILLDEWTLLVYGGTGIPFAQRRSNKMFTCDLRQLHWSRIVYSNDHSDGIDMPQPGYGQAIVIDRTEECIYICGGTDGFEYNLDVHRFDWNTKRWSHLGSAPDFIEARYRHEMALWQGKLYVIGGGTSQRSFSNDCIPVFDLATRKWSLEPSEPYVWQPDSRAVYPESRFSHACGVNGPDVYMVGGTNEENVFDDLWSLHLPTLQWTKYDFCHIPRALYFHSATITEEGELSVFGGVFCLRTKERSNCVYNCWVRIPTLQKLAKLALLDSLRRQEAAGGVMRRLHICNEQTEHERTSANQAHTSLDMIKQYLTRNHINWHQIELPDD